MNIRVLVLLVNLNAPCSLNKIYTFLFMCIMNATVIAKKTIEKK